MVVRAGREFLAIPGPTTMPDEVLRAMHRPAFDIYSDQMAELTDGLLRDLNRLFVTKGRPYIYIGNGHGAWEAALSNVLSRGDKVLVLESGRFAVGWGKAAAAMGLAVETLPGDWRRAVQPAEVEARLREDKHHTIKAILVVQVDTASGVYNDIEAVGQAIRSAGHPALFMVDGVASLGCMPFKMDEWGVVFGREVGLRQSFTRRACLGIEHARIAGEEREPLDPIWCLRDHLEGDDSAERKAAEREAGRGGREDQSRHLGRAVRTSQAHNVCPCVEAIEDRRVEARVAQRSGQHQQGRCRSVSRLPGFLRTMKHKPDLSASCGPLRSQSRKR